ncbi:MAG: FAD:protein FMN transferase [Clostridia bacterium]|nr:FAD:protein FMN transferase [Clostridia bacterium]
MATTGDYERYFEQDGVRYHHILDPFTGKPSDSGLISVTVFSENGTLADSFSTSIFLQGKEGLNKYLNRDDCMIIAVTEDFDVYASPALREKIKINPSKDQYNFIFGSLEEN